jgi:hypothetical protein
MFPRPSRRVTLGELESPMKKWASLDLFHVPDTIHLRLPHQSRHHACTAAYFMLLMLVNVGHAYNYSYYGPVLDADDCE